MSTNGDHLAMLHALEARHDEQLAEAGAATDQLPSADELAEEVERFLRDQEER